ncbi:MAG: hypothetical protein WDL87_10890 [Candidatus Omnitrophota bacterium]|jgi:hypothetical protein
MSNHDINEARDRVCQLMDKTKVYVETDLRKMLDSECNSDEYSSGGLAVPIGLTCFAAMDLFGFLLGKSKKSVTEHNFEIFMGLFPEQGYEQYAKPLNEFYRNGLSHHFFPKGCGIKRGHPKDKILERGLDQEEKLLDYLNVDALANAVLGSLERIREELRQPNSVELIKNINKQLNHLKNGISKKLEHITPSPTTQTTTSAVGSVTLPPSVLLGK